MERLPHKKAKVEKPKQPPTVLTEKKPIHSPAPKAPTSPDGMILDMLNNIKMNGYNASKEINGGLGGLWINWRYGTSPLQTNLNGSGSPDGPGFNPPRHDPLTDLRYMHALLLYKSRHPADTQFDSEIARYTTIIKKEFTTQPHNERGWLYDILVDMYHLSKDIFYQQAAHNLVAYIYSNYYHPSNGLIYQTSPQYTTGYYRVDLAIEDACAMIQEGTISKQVSWVSAGKEALQQLYATAYLPQYQTFLFQLKDVLLPNGTVNPNPSIFRGPYQNFTIEGGQVRTGAAGQEALSLLHTYIATKDQAYLDHATNLLDGLTSNKNVLRLWDTQNQGYFAATIFPGATIKNPGAPTISDATKEAGRQMQLLQTFRVANSLTNNRYQDMQNALLNLLLQKAYYAPQHGVLYEMTSNWQVVVLNNGKHLDWATAEAMGIVLEGLFSLEETTPSTLFQFN